jgi:hypothetical protein
MALLERIQYSSDARNLRGNFAGVALAGDEVVPSLSTLADNISGVPRLLLVMPYRSW